MQQYLELLKAIKERGTYKPPAREGMPGTQSLFGYQFRHNLTEGFPLLTTKKVSFKNVVVELLWFLRGDTNIKYLVDNGCNIWNEDAYNYYSKKLKEIGSENFLSLESFIEGVKARAIDSRIPGYTLGDCGFQYGKVWRDWQNDQGHILDFSKPFSRVHIDQIKNVITSLRENPESRRHIVTAIDPAHDKELALYWCHAMFQFNCRPLTLTDRMNWWFGNCKPNRDVVDYFDEHLGGEAAMKELDKSNVPRYYLDCQLYQRSADVVLGVPYNIASYALLTHILAKICNMIPGEFVHTFGDVHIYDNHKDAVEEQLNREPKKLPQLDILVHMKDFKVEQFEWWLPTDFTLRDYDPYPAIKAELSTGLKK